MKLLLLSNSGKPIYHWCKKIIKDFIDTKELTFISAAAVYDPNEYFLKAQESLSEVGLRLKHLVLDKSVKDKLAKSEAFLIGGGNTYHLLSELKEYGLVDILKEQVQNGALYIGISAGANIASPNILTTNDWNVLGSTYFDGLNLVPFNLNPHYNAPQDKVLTSAESRDERVFEYFEFQNNPVVAIEEETYLEIDNDKVIARGKGMVKTFLKGKDPKIYKSGDFVKF